MRLTIIGAGYVGLVTGACLADLGNQVICVDNDTEKVDLLSKSDKIPIYEPGLEELVKKNKENGRLAFSSDIEFGVKDSEIIFICVGTPSRDDGSADLTGVEKVSRIIAEHIDSYKLVVEKSTVPVETSEWIKKTINTFKKNGCEFDIASNPEFLREGSAIEDFMNPDRIVIGVESKKAESMLKELYAPIETKIVVSDIKGAEIIKHASNSFLATKISFINAISNLCDRTGADVNDVAEGIGLDSRINRHFLKAGVGFGGSCFPKDIKAFIHISEKLGYSFGLLKEVEKINQEQKDRVIGKVEEMLWNLSDKTIAVWGLAFKPHTDDIRSAPSMDIVKSLLKEKAKVKVFDPEAMEKFKQEIGDKVVYCKDVYDAAQDADCVILVTEWNEFKEVDWDRVKSVMKHPAVLDGRNIYDSAKLRNLGFKYDGIGRR
ncbi:MAG: UDP-glucose/GDP-mannose dehydrogenase family protein [Candidatus Omnitrophota bacterium]